MSTGVSTDFKEQVRSRTDLVQLIGETIALTPRRGGAEYVGLCPFHDDHKPSMCVYPERQSFRCWVCDKGGDCFSWVMDYENVEFRTALELLAKRANLEIPRGERRRPNSDDPKKPHIYDVLRWAEDEFHRCFLQTPAAERARQYMKDRGFTAQTIGKFRVGYHPDSWEWTLSRAGGRFAVEQLIEAGLAGKKQETGRTFDFFVDRVMFPIRDDGGRTVAFGGRVLPDKSQGDAPKYWNGPDTPVFAKSKLLYGFDAARQAIRQSGTAVVMEGYTDCMMAHQYGVSQCIATLGTALTETHVLALKRFARKVVLVFDGDTAGQNAAERSLLKFLPMEVDLRILTLPDGLDPADFLRNRGADALQQQIDGAVEAWDYKLRATVGKHGLGSTDAKQQVMDEMLDLLARVPRLSGSVRQDILLGNLSGRLRVDEQVLRNRLSETRQRLSRRANPSQSVRIDPAEDSAGLPSRGEAQNRKHDALERELLELLFAEPGAVEKVRQQVPLEAIGDPALRRLLEVCYQLAAAGTVPTYERVTVELEDAALKRLAAHLDQSAHEKQTVLKESGHGSPLDAALERLRWRIEQDSHEKSKGEFVQRQGASSGLDPRDKELLRLISEYHQKRAARKSLT